MPGCGGTRSSPRAPGRPHVAAGRERLGRLQRAPGIGAHPAAGRSRFRAVPSGGGGSHLVPAGHLRAGSASPFSSPFSLDRPSRARWRSQRSRRHGVLRALVPCAGVPGAARARPGARCPARPGAGTAPAPLIPGPWRQPREPVFLGKTRLPVFKV